MSSKVLTEGNLLLQWLALRAPTDNCEASAVSWLFPEFSNHV